MGKKDEIRKSETFVNYDAEGKKIIRTYSFGRKVKKNEPNVEDNVFKKLRENSKNLKEYFPAYPFRSGLQKADGFLHYSPMCEKSLIKSIGGFQLHLTQAELAIIDKTVGSRKLSDIKCFLIQKCNNQNTESLSWNDILDNLKFWLKQTNSQRKTTSGKAGEILEAQAKPLILQLAEKLRVMHKFSYRIIASLPFSITTLDGKKATPAPITTSDDIPANCKFLTTWEDVFDSYSNAFEQFLLWNEDAISLASNIQYEKNRELLISLTRIKHRATEILSSIKHDRKSKSTLASGQDEIDTARGSLTNLLNCDLPDCSAVDFFVELKDLPSFADELEAASLTSLPETTAEQNNNTVDELNTFYSIYPLRDGFKIETYGLGNRFRRYKNDSSFIDKEPLTIDQTRMVMFFTGGWQDSCQVLREFLIQHNLAEKSECDSLTWSDILNKLYIFAGKEKIPDRIMFASLNSKDYKDYGQYITTAKESAETIRKVDLAEAITNEVKADPAKRKWWKQLISWIFKKTSRVVYAVIAFIAFIGIIVGILAGLHELGWLEPIKAFIYKILLHR